MSDILGIDLGTTHSLVGVMDSGFPLLLADEEGRRLTPSVVSWAKPGEPVVGWAALRMRPVAPESTVVAVKRLMGARVGEEEFAGVPLADGKPGQPVQLAVGDATYSPEEVSAHILRKLKHDAEKTMERTFERAVITVPAYFNDAQRQATKRAGELAGLRVERIVSEPTAAALAYGMDKLKDRSRLAVYDFGGGTFDVSILELEGGTFRVLSTHGNTKLGGEDINARITGWVLDQSGLQLGDPVLRARLQEEVEEAKRRLSDEETTILRLPFVEGEQGVEIELSRTELERLAGPLVESTRKYCRQALFDAGLEANAIDEVILVGGSTRMPMVRRLVGEIFQKPPHTEQNPDEAVALGATLQAGILGGSVNDMVLLDITPLSLGIETVGGLMNVLIPRNTSIPTKAGEVFTTAQDGQQAMRVRVLQGEREMARDNWPLGEFEVEFEAAPRGKARVGVQFEIDANGILHVLARDLATGKDVLLDIESAVDVSDEAVEAMISESIEHAYDDMSERVFTEAKLKAEEMLPAVEKALAAVGDHLPEEERTDITSKMGAVREAVAAGAANPLKQAVQALDEATQGLAARLVEKAMGR